MITQDRREHKIQSWTLKFAAFTADQRLAKYSMPNNMLIICDKLPASQFKKIFLFRIIIVMFVNHCRFDIIIYWPIP